MVPPNPDDSDGEPLHSLHSYVVNTVTLQSCLHKYTHHTRTETPRISSTLQAFLGDPTTRHLEPCSKTWVMQAAA